MSVTSLVVVGGASVTESKIQLFRLFIVVVEVHHFRVMLLFFFFRLVQLGDEGTPCAHVSAIRDRFGWLFEHGGTVDRLVPGINVDSGLGAIITRWERMLEGVGLAERLGYQFHAWLGLVSGIGFVVSMGWVEVGVCVDDAESGNELRVRGSRCFGLSCFRVE